MASKSDQITIAVGQIDVRIFDKPYNLGKMEEVAKRAKRENAADLVVFPECAVTGYCFSDVDEVKSVAEPLSGPSVTKLRELSEREKISIVFGTIEQDGDCLYNTVCFCEPDGRLQHYRKTHLPLLALDKFVSPGDKIAVMDSAFGKIGIMICYDLRFPEVARELALQGARIIIEPTNLPRGGEAHMEFFTRARACENRIYFVSCNRIGQERGFCFIGRSQVIDVSGDVICGMGENEGMICTKLDLSLAERKDMVIIPGEYETHMFEDRRPELYTHIRD